MSKGGGCGFRDLPKPFKRTAAGTPANFRKSPRDFAAYSRWERRCSEDVRSSTIPKLQSIGQKAFDRAQKIVEHRTTHHADTPLNLRDRPLLADSNLFGRETSAAAMPVIREGMMSIRLGAIRRVLHRAAPASKNQRGLWAAKQSEKAARCNVAAMLLTENRRELSGLQTETTKAKLARVGFSPGIRLFRDARLRRARGSARTQAAADKGFLPGDRTPAVAAGRAYGRRRVCAEAYDERRTAPRLQERSRYRPCGQHHPHG